MKTIINIKMRLLMVLLPVIMAQAHAGAQNGEIVYAGQTSILSVQEVPGHSYIWELYSTVEGVNFAQEPGNCPPDLAYFTDADTGPSVTVMWASPGLYFFKVTAYNTDGCMNLKVGKIEVSEPLPGAEFIDVPEICFGDFAVLTVMLSGTPPFTITYTDGSDVFTESNIMDNTFDIVVSPAATTSYWITEVVDAHGYPNNELVGPAVVVVNPLPEIITLNITHAFDGQPNGSVEVIAGSATLPLEYSLDGINWQDSRFITGLLPGSYIVKVRDGNLCIAGMPFDIHNIVSGEVEIIAGTITGCQHSVVETPVIVYGFNNIIGFTLELEFDYSVLEFEGIAEINAALKVGSVEGQNQKAGSLVITFVSPVPVTIDPDQSLFYMQFTGVGEGKTILDWQEPYCIFIAAGNYPVPTIYTYGEIEILPAPQPILIGAGTYCEGEHLTLKAESHDSQNVSYLWQGPGGVSYQGNSWTLGYLGLDHSGTYTLHAVDDLGCKSVIDFEVLVNPLPDVNFAGNLVECMDEPVWLEPGVWYTSYKWQDGSVHSSFLATQEGEYWVEVTDENGCKNIASITLMPCDFDLLVPNAFTPNGDGLNDIFMPVYSGIDLPDYTMLIFNKWGQLLFESKHITSGWDGRFKGQPMPMDVYTYVITYRLPAHFGNRELQRLHGNVMLLR